MFKTNEKGVVFGSNESYLVDEKSDDLFYGINTTDGKKSIIFPCGTYVIEETNAPTGFTQPTYDLRTFITTIIPKENSTTVNTGSFGRVIYVPKEREGFIGFGLDWEAW